MPEKLVLNTMVLQVATEGLNTEIHWPGGKSGVTIGPGFDIGASRVKGDDLETILKAIGISSDIIQTLRKTTYEERLKVVKEEDRPATGADASGLMTSLGLKGKVVFTEQQSLDIGYIVKNRPGSGFQANVEDAFCLSAKNLHPALREALVKVGYGSPTLLGDYGAAWDAELSRAATPAAQGEVLMRMFQAAIEKREADMKMYAEQLRQELQQEGVTKLPYTRNELNEYHSRKGAGNNWFNARVRCDGSRGMLYFVEKVTGILKDGGEVIIEDKPLTVKQLADPNDKNLEIMRFTKAKTYSPDKSDESIQKGILEKRKEMAAIQNQVSKVDAKLLDICRTSLKQSVPTRSPEGKKLQIVLKELGFYNSSIDGDFGKGSKAALDAYMKSVGEKSVDKAKADLLKKYDTKYPPVQPIKNNPNNQNPNNNNAHTTTSKSWWDMLQEMYNAQYKYPQIQQESWWSKVTDFVSGGLSAFSSLFIGGSASIALVVEETYKYYQQLIQKYQQQQQQQQQNNNTTNNSPELETYKAAFAGKGTISDSVGADGGKNNAKDVIIVRGLLFANKYLSDTIQTVLGSKESRAKYSKTDAVLENAIRKFQTEKVGLSKPDGRVDAGGGTLKALNGGKLPAPKPNPQPNPQPQPEEEGLNVAPVSPDLAVFGCFN